MPVKCPKCGYDNEDAALSCNLCQHVLRKEVKPAAAAAAEPRTIASADDLGVVIKAAVAASTQGRMDEAQRLMARPFLELPLSEGRDLITEAGKMWLESMSLSAEGVQAARLAIAAAAAMAGEGKFDEAFKLLQTLLAPHAQDLRQNMLLTMAALGVKTAAQGRGRKEGFSALVEKGIQALLTKGQEAEGLALLSQARDLIPDPPRSEQDKAARERITGLLQAYRKGAAPAPAKAAGPDPKKAELLRQAKAAFQDGKMEAALECFRQIVGLDPSDASAWSNQGTCLHRLERFEEALAAYEKAAALRPGEAPDWLNQALCLDQLKRGPQALASCDKGLALAPFSVRLWYAKGGILLEHLGRYDEAAACFDEVLGIDPRFAWAAYKKACAQDKAGKGSAALASFERFIQMAPANMEAQLEIARRRAEALRPSSPAV